jgi:DNA-binding YbaB/EbfC family protein
MKNRFGGYGGGGGGGMGNMQQLMKQAQAMQQKMAEAQEEVENAEVTGSAAGEAVKVTVNGNKAVKAIHIDASVCDPEDPEMLEDLLLAALSDAYEKADAIKEEKMGQFSGLGL